MYIYTHTHTHTNRGKFGRKTIYTLQTHLLLTGKLHHARQHQKRSTNEKHKKRTPHRNKATWKHDVLRRHGNKT